MNASTTNPLLKNIFILPFIAAIAGISVGEEVSSVSKKSWLKAEVVESNNPSFVEGEPSGSLPEEKEVVKKPSKAAVLVKGVLSETAFDNKNVVKTQVLPAGMIKGVKTTVSTVSSETTVSPVVVVPSVVSTVETTVVATKIPTAAMAVPVTLGVAPVIPGVAEEITLGAEEPKVNSVKVTQVTKEFTSVPVEGVIIQAVPAPVDVPVENSSSSQLDSLQLGGLDGSDPILLESSLSAVDVKEVDVSTKVVKKKLSVLERLRRVSEGRVALEELNQGSVGIGETYLKKEVTTESKVVVVAVEEDSMEEVEVYDLVDENSPVPVRFKVKDYSDKSRNSTQLRYYRATRPVYDGDVY